MRVCVRVLAAAPVLFPPAHACPMNCIPDCYLQRGDSASGWGCPETGGLDYYSCAGFTQFSAGEIVFAIDTFYAPSRRFRLRLHGSGPFFVFSACDTDSLVSYCLRGGEVSIENVRRGETLIVLMD